MNKIDIITLQNVRNYGSALQAYATQKIFEQLDWHPFFFNYYKEKKRISFITRSKSYIQGNGLLKKLLKVCLLLPTFMKQDYVFGDFLKKYLNIIPLKVSSEKDFKKLSLDADIYCTGSDQTWNSGWNNGILPPLFLSFAPKGKKCIAYAASFGKTKLDDWEKEKTKLLLSRYSAISVREASAVKIVKDLNLGLSAIHVLDPTLQLNRHFWRKLSKPVKYKRYCFLYQLNHNPDFDKFAMQFAHNKGLKLLRWCNRYDQIRLPADEKIIIPKVEDFISFIDHSDFVLTDSFHCTAFSCNLNKQFLAIYPNNYSSRIASLLELLHLIDRHIEKLDINEYLNKAEIDFTVSNNILEKERQKGISFLRSALL